MSIQLTVPEVGESITEVQIGEWLKGEGDYVQRDEDLVVIETDKATVEIAAPESGRIEKILKKAGDTAAVNEVIGYIESGAAGRAQEGEKKQPPQGVDRAAEKQPKRSKAAPAEEQPPDEAGTERRETDLAEKPRAAKVVQREPRKQELESEARETFSPPKHKPIIKATSEQEELEDKEAMSIGQAVSEQAEIKDSGGHLPSSDGERGEPKAARPSSEKDTAGAAAGANIARPASGDDREERSLPLTPLRRKLAERLVQAQHNAALLTTFNEIDMSAVIALREKHQETFRQKHGVKLGFMSFFVKATIEALARVPEINAEIRGENAVYRSYYDIGVAVGGGKGLVVPVLRNAERLSFAEIEQTIGDFARRAEENKLKPAELQGGTFTISNGGVYGSLLSTPIVNPPQSGILGLHAIQDRPVARDGAVVVRPMMYVALTYDHRMVDGREAVTFLKQVKNLIEDPVTLLLEL